LASIYPHAQEIATMMQQATQTKGLIDPIRAMVANLVSGNAKTFLEQHIGGGQSRGRD